MDKKLYAKIISPGTIWKWRNQEELWMTVSSSDDELLLIRLTESSIFPWPICFEPILSEGSYKTYLCDYEERDDRVIIISYQKLLTR